MTTATNTGGWTANLTEMRGKTHFNYEILQAMREGRFDGSDDLPAFLPNVRHILREDEAFRSFLQFMDTLRTDAASLRQATNAVRRTYRQYVNGTPQKWQVIHAEEYREAVKIFSEPQRDASCDGYWENKIRQWADFSRYNIGQLAANSYLTSGPDLDPRTVNPEGYNTFCLLWYSLTGDEKIPYRNPVKTYAGEKYMTDTYWRPFVWYTGTCFGDAGKAYETDSPLGPLYDVAAGFDRYEGDTRNILVTLNRLLRVVHGRGSFSYLFMDEK